MTRRKISAFIPLIFGMLVMYGQEVETESPQKKSVIDSIHAKLPNASNDIEKFYLLHYLAIEYVDWDNERAFTLVKEAEDVAIKTGDSLCIVKSQRLKGQIMYRLGMPGATVATIKPLLKYGAASRNTNEYLTVLNLMAVCYLSMSQFDNALNYHLRTLHFAQEMNHKTYVATSLMNIGVCYYKLKDYTKALPFMINSYLLSDSLKRVDFSQPLNISLCYAYLNDFENAKKYLRLSKDLCGSNCIPFAELHIKYASGYIHFVQNELDDAEHDYKVSLKIAEQIPDQRMYLDNINMLARIQIKKDRLKAAKKYLDKGESVINTGIPFNMEMIKVYGQLGELYLKIEDYERASHYQSQYITLKDSIYNEAVTTSLMRIESKHQERKNLSKIDSQKTVIADRERTIGRQIALNVIVGLLFVTTVAMLIALFKSYRLKKTMNILLAKKIKERTRELEGEISDLLTNLKVREYELERLSGAIKEAINSLTGLSNIAFAIQEREMQNALNQLRDTMVRLAKRQPQFTGPHDKI